MQPPQKYQCRFKECPSTLYYEYDPNIKRFIVFYNEEEHREHDNDPKTSGIHPIIKQVIKDNVNLNCTPQLMLDYLRVKYRNNEQGALVPNYRQIANFMTTIKRDTKFLLTTASVGSINEWCHERTNIPEDFDQIFIRNTEITSSNLTVMLTSKRLLSTCKLTKHLLADATYKLVKSSILFYYYII
jgi:hypothetical protein